MSRKFRIKKHSGPKVYRPPKYPSMDKDLALEWLIRVKDVLKTLKVKWTLLYGTFLGAYRDHDFIPWDFDIDTGAMPKDRIKHGLIVSALKKKGFSVAKCHMFIQAYYKNVPGHIMFSTESKGPAKHWENIKAGRPDLYKIRGVQFPGPAYPEEYLTHVYGDWKTPRKLSDPRSRPYHKG